MHTPQDAHGRYWQAMAMRAMTTAMLLALIAGVTVGTLVWQRWQGLPVHYFPPGGPGISQPGIIPLASAEDFARRCLTSRFTYSVRTAKGTLDAFAACIHPSMHLVYAKQAEREVKAVKEAGLSVHTEVEQVTVLRQEPTLIRLYLQALRTVSIGREQVREEKVLADVTIQPYYSAGTPAGMVLTVFKVDPAFTATGD